MPKGIVTGYYFVWIGAPVSRLALVMLLWSKVVPCRHVRACWAFCSEVSVKIASYQSERLQTAISAKARLEGQIESIERERERLANELSELKKPKPRATRAKPQADKKE